MTKIIIFKDKQKDVLGFEMSGHAGFAKSGSDIVCAAISMLATNAYNSLEQLTNETFGYEENERKGYMKLILNENAGDDAKLLLNSMLLGLSELEKQYSNYLKLKFKEV